MAKQASASDDLPISRTDVSRICIELADEAAASEVSPELSTAKGHDVAAVFEDVAADWNSGLRAVRTVPALNAYHLELDREVGDAVKRSLAGLDATINALDDVVDTETADGERRFSFAVRAAFASHLAFRSVPAEYEDQLYARQFDYLLELSRIPFVEREAVERMAATDDREQLVGIVEGFYDAVSRDIRLFGRTPAIVEGVDDAVADRIVADLRTHRARHWLFEDLRHVPRDVRDGDRNPVRYLLEACDDPEEVVSIMERVADAFTYSAAGEETYVDALRVLEERPEDLERTVAEGMEVLSEAAPGD